MNALPSLVIKSDPLLGLYVCVDPDDATEFREWLEEDDIHFLSDGDYLLRLMEPGRRTFVFGVAHPIWLRGVLRDRGYPAEIADGVRLPEDSYGPPVDRLLKLGKPPDDATSVDCGALGLDRAHVPELIRMATDGALNAGPSDSPIVYAPIHAWRALGQFRAEEAVVPLLGLLRRVDEDQDDWVSEDLPRALAEIGPAAIPACADYLGNVLHGEWARVAAARVIELVAKSHPETRAECVGRVRGQLEKFGEQSETLNACLIGSLLDLKAIETLPDIEQAFASGRVDEAVNGDWEDAQIELGLKTKREHPRKPNSLTKWREEFQAQMAMEDALGEALEFDEPGEPYIAPPKVGRNDQCPCGSGKKYKKCCGG